jgi:membrane carboxypeptidase/penicillin-binding protein PbpC
VDWPGEFRAWAAAQGLVQDAAPASVASGEAEAGGGRRQARLGRGERALRIVSPPEGATYLKDPTLRDDFQQLTLRAEAAPGSRPLRWAINGVEIAAAAADAVVRWPLVPGRHTVLVRDERGHEDRVSFLVR